MSDTQDLEFDTPLEEEAGTIEVASGKRAVYTEPADVEWTLERPDVVSSAGYSIYEGQRFRGRIRDAFVRGRPVLREDTPLNDAVGHGRYVRRRLRS
jgi:dihydroorotase-like cyclic amidohydrolase